MIPLAAWWADLACIVALLAALFCQVMVNRNQIRLNETQREINRIFDERLALLERWSPTRGQSLAQETSHDVSPQAKTKNS